MRPRSIGSIGSRVGGFNTWRRSVPKPGEFQTLIKQVVDDGAVGAFLVGNYGDAWTRDNKVGLIGELVTLIKEQKIIAGVGGHELRTVTMVEKAGIAPDFYVKTLHSNNYWSKRQPGQDKDVIENYGIDNYWCKDPEQTIRFMSELERPWIAYKVLAAGAIHPKAGLKHAFENGADFALVGMFDFQVAENVAIANELLADQLTRAARLDGLSVTLSDLAAPTQRRAPLSRASHLHRRIDPVHIVVVIPSALTTTLAA